MNYRKPEKTIYELKEWQIRTGADFIPEEFTAGYWEVRVDHNGEPVQPASNFFVELFSPAYEDGSRDCWSDILNEKLSEDARHEIVFNLFYRPFAERLQHTTKPKTFWLLISELVAEKIIKLVDGTIEKTLERTTL